MLYCRFITIALVLFPIHKATARLRREAPRIRELILLLLAPAIFNPQTLSLLPLSFLAQSYARL